MAAKTKLSKNILEMKFMKRTALRETKIDSEETQQIDDQHWVLDIPHLAEKECKFQFDPSYASLEELPYGRMSFRGFNPEIEKIMKARNTEIELSAAALREKENEVSDEDMAARYESLVSTVAKKFTKKRHRSSPTPASDSSDETTPVPGKKEKHSKSKKDKKGFMIPTDD